MSVYAIGDKETLSKENKTLGQIIRVIIHSFIGLIVKVIMNI